MGIERLERAIANLPPRDWTIADLAKLRECAGKRVNAEESAVFRELLREKWKHFSEPARRALEVLAGAAAPDLKPTKLEYAGKFATGIEEQSAIAFVSKDVGFLIVDDESSVVWRLPQPAPAERGGKLEAEELRKDKGDMIGLEGAAYDAKTKSLLTCSEDGRHVYELSVDGAAVGKPKELGRLANIANQDNKGWEGITILPAEYGDDKRARIVAVHEGSPCAIGIFDRETLELDQIVQLPETMDPMPEDLSDITFDPKTGRFFILSDESRLIWEVEIRRTAQLLGAGPPLVEWAVVPVHATKIPGVAGKDPQPEGITIDQRGDLWVSCERGEALLHFER